jgi:hypothetical protein
MNGRQSVLVENVCSSGARLRARAVPNQGKELMIRVGSLNLLSRVAWSGDRKCGITFDAPLNQLDVITLKKEGRWGTVMGVV